MMHQGFRGVTINRIRRDTDTAGNSEFMAIHRDRLAHAVHQALDHSRGQMIFWATAQYQHELITPISAQRIVSAQRIREPIGYDAQQFVAHGMAKAVVDLLETVKIHKGDPDREPMPICIANRIIQFVEQRTTVDRTGQ